MTAAGQEQAAAGQAIAPALAKLNKSLASTRNAGPAERGVVAHQVHGAFQSLASAVGRAGYNAARQWGREFCDGQAADPQWLQRASHTAGQYIQDGGNLTRPVRALSSAGADLNMPVIKAGHAASTACHDLVELMLEHDRALKGPQVPEFAVILAALRDACEPLAAAASALAPGLEGLEPDWESIWCEDFDFDRGLAAAYRDAARWCRAGGRALKPVCDQTAADVRTWRSRSRTRPGRQLDREAVIR